MHYEEIADIELGVSGNVTCCVHDPGKNMAYVGVGVYVVFVNLVERLAVDIISFSGNVTDIHLDPSSQKLYILSSQYFWIYNLNTSEQELFPSELNYHTLPSSGSKIFKHSTDNTLYILHSNDISVFNIADYTFTTYDNIGSASLNNGAVYDEDDFVPTTTTRSPNAAQNMFVAQADSNSVSNLNLSNNTVVSSFSVGEYPQAIVKDNTLGKTYVSNYNSEFISVINTSTSAVVDNISVPKGVVDLFVDETHDLLFAVNRLEHSLISISLESNSILNTLDIQLQPNRVVHSAKQNKIFITATDEAGNLNGHVLRVINGNTFAFETTINYPSSFEPFGLVIDNDNDILYVTSKENNRVYIYDIYSSHLVLTSNFVATSPYDITYSSSGLLYVSSIDLNKVYVLANDDPNYSDNQYRILFQISVSESPTRLLLDDDDKRLYVSHSLSDKITIINTKNHTIIGTIDMPNNPQDMSFGATATTTSLPPFDIYLTIPFEENYATHNYLVFYGNQDDELGFNSIPTSEVPTPLTFKEIFIFIDGVISNRITTPTIYIDQDRPFSLTIGENTYNSTFGSGEDYGQDRRINLT